eukprot:TRINITY_DN3276_c0_g1_i2.p1 TRINITY_DN3276_c0_g1~~TRINITY_DN3276_c0_g1_i2.p1  ORF type:complete len:189 (-),score=12.33 TRINITY_DN3276_c0_g1_i2:5-571(-)
MSLLTKPKSIATELLYRYLIALQNNPLRTKAITSSITSSIGDLLAQTIKRIQSPNPQPYDLKRTAKFASFNFLISAPILHWYYKLLDVLLKNYKGNTRLILQLLLDRLICGPLVILLFFTYFEIVSMGSIMALKKKIQLHLIPTAVKAMIFWLPVQFFNFKYIPMQLRVLFGNLAAIVWTVYFSVVNK